MAETKTSPLEIQFSKDTYIAGENVSGFVLLKNPQKVKVVTLTVEGTISVRYSLPTHVQSKTENCFDQVLKIWDEDKPPLDKGENKFPFEFNLPVTLPSSFKSKNGFIQYKAKLTLSRPWTFNQKVEKVFYITGVFDLKDISDVMLPLEKEKLSHGLFRGLSKPGPVVMAVSMNKRGYVQGEYVNLVLDFQKKDQLLRKISAILYQNAVYQASKYNKKEVLRKVGESTKFVDSELQNQPRFQEKIRLEVSLTPHMVPITTKTSLIDISYYVLVEGVYSSGVTKRKVLTKLPISIGNIPLEERLEEASDLTQPTAPPFEVVTEDRNPQRSEASANIYPTLPPAYESLPW